MDTRHPGFSIEATSHCRDGRWPRWSWWIRGIENSGRYGVVGTDEYGHGLYLYSFRADRSSQRHELLGGDEFSLGDDVSRQQANTRIIEVLLQLGWGQPKHDAPSGGLPGGASSGFLRI